MSLKSWIAIKAVQGKLPLWMYRIAGKRASKILKLEEVKMGETTVEKTPWYKSKAKWAAVCMAVVGCVQPVSTAFGHPVQVPLWVIEFLTGLGIYGVRDAISKS